MRKQRNIARHHVALILALVGVMSGVSSMTAPVRLASAQAAAPNWSYTGSLNTARLFHTTTSLANGKVLVVGGCNDAGCLSLDSAELYDPVTGTWGLTGGLSVDRVEHSATLLPNGKVLVAGGWNRGVVGSAELYDPVAGTWSFTGNLNVARADHSATLLPDGKVLVAGGNTLETELYDPATGTWSITGNLNTAREMGHTQTLLPNGKVLVAGGTGNSEWSFNNLASCELYDPNTGTWSLTGSLNVARFEATATLLPNGNVLVTGGESQDGALNNSAELYNPTTEAWSYTGSFSTGRYGHTATLLPNGKVLVAGGHDWHTNTTFDSADVYDPATGNWSVTAKLNTTRMRHKAVLLQSGKVLVVGGCGGGRLLSAELYDSGSSSTINPMDDAQFFVRQHYKDFLNRDADPDGLAFWTNEIVSCGGDAGCIEAKRINVSGAYFLSIEFQETGYELYRLYKAAYGNRPGEPVPIRFDEFLADAHQIAGGVIVNQPGWQQVLENNKDAFTKDFVQRSRFTTSYSPGISDAEFVDKLNSNAGQPLSQTERDRLVSDLAGGTKTRAQVLRAVAEDSDLIAAEFNRAFVLMEYFGYLRRNPNDAPDGNFDGYNFWLNKLNSFNGNYIDAEMVKAFLSSTEYRRRFGP